MWLYNMSNIIILRGPYCSGKTTWASKYCQKNKNSIRLSPRDIIKQLASGGSTSDSIEVSNEMFDAGLLKSMVLGKNIIIDSENFLDSQVKNLLEKIERICLKNRSDFIKNNISIKIFNKTPLKVCIERNNKLANPKNEKTIERSYNYFHK